MRTFETFIDSVYLSVLPFPLCPYSTDSKQGTMLYGNKTATAFSTYSLSGLCDPLHPAPRDGARIVEDCQEGCTRRAAPPKSRYRYLILLTMNVNQDLTCI